MKTGSILGALAVKGQEARDEEYVQKASAELQVEQARQQAFFETEQDVSRFAPEVARGYAQLGKKFSGAGGVSRDAQERVSLMLGTSQRMAGIHADKLAHKRQFLAADQAIMGNIQTAIEGKRYAEVLPLARRRQELGTGSEGETQQLMATVAQHQREDGLWQVIADHTQEAAEWFADEEQLTEYKLTKRERREWAHRAMMHATQQEQATLQDVLAGVVEGGVDEPGDIEVLRKRMGRETHAALSSLLALPGGGPPRNDDAEMERMIAQIENVKVGTDRDSVLGLVKLGVAMRQSFLGPKFAELKGRLIARMKRGDAAQPSVLGPALEKLNQWGGDGRAQEIREIRGSLELASKTGKITTEEDALDFMARKALNQGWVLTRHPLGGLGETGGQGAPGALSERESRVSDLYVMSERERGQKLDRIVLSGLSAPRNAEAAKRRFINDELLSLRYGLHRAELKDRRQELLVEVAKKELGFEGESIQDGQFFVLMRRRLRQEKEMEPYVGAEKLEGIPVNFQWDPGNEALKTTPRIGDYPSSTGDIGEERREQWKTDFRATYGHMAVNAAWKNAVPARLLTVLSANEMAASEWGEFKAFADREGLGKSWGPLQITAETARKEGAARNEREAEHGFLNQPGNNFDVGGRLLHGYLVRLAEDVAAGRHKDYSESFKILSGLNSTRSQIYDDLKAIRAGDAHRVFTLRPSDHLVRAVAAIWNNGFEIVRVENIRVQSEGARNHAENAAMMYTEVDDLMPFAKK